MNGQPLRQQHLRRHAVHVPRIPSPAPGAAAPRGSQPMAAEEPVDSRRGAKRPLEAKTRPRTAPVRRRRFPQQEAGSGTHEKTPSMKETWQIDSHRIVAVRGAERNRVCGRPVSQKVDFPNSARPHLRFRCGFERYSGSVLNRTSGAPSRGPHGQVFVRGVELCRVFVFPAKVGLYKSSRPDCLRND